MPAAKKVTVEGVEYPSVGAACEAYGKSYKAARKYMKEHGCSFQEAVTFDYRSCIYKGVKYPDKQAAAKAAGMSYGGFLKMYAKHGPDGRPVVLAVEGKEYHTLSAAARDYELSESNLGWRLREGWTPEQAVGIEPPPPHKHRRQIVLEGVKYPSIAAAARRYGVDPMKVTGRLNACGWTLEQAFGIESPPERHNTPKEVEFEGVVYPSMNDLARAHNTTGALISARMKDGWTLEEAVHGETQDKGWERGGVVYRAVHLDSGKMYFGITRTKPNRRWSVHISRAMRKPSTKFEQAINKFGPESFHFEVIDHADTGKELEKLESEYIEVFNTIEDGFNTAA